jgi:hypothetical protein
MKEEHGFISEYVLLMLINTLAWYGVVRISPRCLEEGTVRACPPMFTEWMIVDCPIHEQQCTERTACYIFVPGIIQSS